MRVREKAWLWVGTALCLLWTACAPKGGIVVAGEKAPSPSAKLAVAEVVVRNMVVNLPPDESVFVSFGKSWADAVDPPAEFLDRLGDIRGEFEPVSEYNEESTRTPLLLIVDVAKWEGDTRATVTATRYRLGTGGSDGFTAQVEWSDGVWRLHKRTDSWSR